MGCEQLVKRCTVFAPHPSYSSVLQDRDGLISPQKMGEIHWRNSRVFPCRTNNIEMHGAPRTLPRCLDTPPCWYAVFKVLKVFRACYDRNQIEDSIIGYCLCRQTVQSVSVALDFVTVKLPIHDGDIDARRPMRDAKFVNHQGARIAHVFGKNLTA